MNTPKGITSPGYRILIVEDNTDLARGLRINLELEGYIVDEAHTAADAEELLGTFCPDLVLLDLMLPDKDGYEVLASVRQVKQDCAVIILSARDQEQDRVSGFQLGADDYVTKPFSVLELMERIKARINSRPFHCAQTYIGEKFVDLTHLTVSTESGIVPLTRQEARLLAVLLRFRGSTLSREHLLHSAWSDEIAPQTRTIDFFINSLRNKLENDPKKPKFLITAKGKGYRLERE